MTPFKAGIIAIVVLFFITAFGFTRYNPFKHPFELKAAVRSANNLQPASPVRIAGVNVGKVTKVEPLKTTAAADVKSQAAAIVTMQIEKPGLPIHKDAQLKIRPRIFLEGNFFVDIQPGTPTAPIFKSGDVVPVQQTQTPVQFGQLLTALQADTRQDLQTLFYEYARKGLGNGGAEAYNRALKYAPDSLRNASIANEASLGREPHDLSNLERGQQRLARSLTFNPPVLKDLVTQLNVTAEAFAREDAALERAVPDLRDTLRAATPSLISIDNALPALRAFARDALPATRSSGPAIDASLPFLTQLRLLIRPQELRGLVHDLRPTIPALARLNRGSIGLLNENRALSACQNKVLVPWATKGIPDPEEPQIDGQPFYKQAGRGLVGLASESRLVDANSPAFHIQAGSGPTNLIYTHNGKNLFALAPGPPEGVRPTKPDHRPNFRPGEPCELQEVPDLNAPLGPADPSRTVSTASGLLPARTPFAKRIAKEGQIQLNEVKDYLRRTAAGKPVVDPLTVPREVYVKRMKKLGLKVLPTGKVVEIRR